MTNTVQTNHLTVNSHGLYSIHNTQDINGQNRHYVFVATVYMTNHENVDDTAYDHSVFRKGSFSVLIIHLYLPKTNHRITINAHVESYNKVKCNVYKVRSKVVMTDTTYSTLTYLHLNGHGSENQYSEECNVKDTLNQTKSTLNSLYYSCYCVF